MKVIEVRDQVRLPLSKCIELVLSGVKFRLFRASVTVVIISLAAAFLMTMLSESLIARHIRHAVQRQTAPRNTFVFWVSRVSQPRTRRELAEELATAKSGDARWQEFEAWGNLTDQQLRDLGDAAQSQTQYLAYFDQLGEGQRRILVGRSRGTDIFTSLQDPAQLKSFQSELKTVPKQLPTSMEEFEAFLSSWLETDELRQMISKGNRRAIERVRQEILKGRGARELFAEADSALPEQLAAHGYRMPAEDLPVVARLAKLSLDAQRIAKTLTMPIVSQTPAKPTDEESSRRTVQVRLVNLLARRRDMGTARVTEMTLFDELSSADGAQWFVETTGMDLSPERVKEVTEHQLAQSKLFSVEASLAEYAGGGGFMGYSSRALSLIAVSFIVCIVGIANAMLMSVTERFREIATMKCLGATDRFIMTNFVLESIIQGIAGGILGVAVGFLLGTLRSWGSYGWMALTAFPWTSILITALFTIIISLVISAAAAVYPAWAAARLAPMEAMRIE